MPSYHDLSYIGGAGTQNAWAIIDGNVNKLGRGRGVPVNAGEALLARQLVWMDPADAQAHPAIEGDRPLLGFVEADTAEDVDAIIQIDGVVVDPDPTPAWSWTPGARLYAGNGATPSAGGLTETPGASLPVAVALSAVAILILPSGLGG